MSDFPLISIITPAYNAGKYISETIDSVINQTYKNWELILVDDCSVDNTSEIIKEYRQKDSRIKYFKLDKNSGVAGIPRNFGIEKAKGNFIAFIDADDIWLPEKLEKQMQFMQQTNADLVYTNVIYFYHDGKEFYTKSRQIKSFFSLLMVNPVSTSSVLLKKTNTLFFDSVIKVGEDQVLWINLYKQGYSFKLLNEFLMRYRYNSNSLLHKSPIKSLFDGYRVINIISKKYKYNLLHKMFLLIAQTIIRSGNVLIGIIKRKVIGF